MLFSFTQKNDWRSVLNDFSQENFSTLYNLAMADPIGIVGCSAEGAALCYRTICIEAEKQMGRHAHPEVMLHTYSLADYMELIYADDWRGVGELMLSSAEKLSRIGAKFLICPDNTIHQALSFIVDRSPLPWLHIADVVATEAKSRGHQKLALTGTRYLVESSVYPSKLQERQIEYLRPTAPERDEIDRIIMDELIYGRCTEAAESYFQTVLRRMKEEGCDAVVLGCTEIPLLMNDRNSPLPTLDSTRLLAKAALQKSLAKQT